MTDPLFSSDDDKVEAALKALRVAAGGIVRGYIYKDEYDRPMIRDFVERYPRLNIADEVRKWAAWMTEFEHRKGKKVRHRARLTTWVQRAATGDYGRFQIEPDVLADPSRLVVIQRAIKPRYQQEAGTSPWAL